MPDFALPDRPGLDELAHTDLLLDALAGRVEADLGPSQDPKDDALTALLGDWRDDLRWPPASALVSQEEAEEALIAGLSGTSGRTGGHRGAVAVGSVAATLLLLSGFGAQVGEARPGDMLYGLHAMFFDEPAKDDQAVVSATADLAKAQQMIDDGEWSRAQDQLAEVSSALQSVDDGGRKQDLIDEVNKLNSMVGTRDPKANQPAPQRAPQATPAPKLSQPAVAPPAPSSPPAAAGPPLASPTPAPKSHHHGHNAPAPIEPVAPPSNGVLQPNAPAPAANGAPAPAAGPATGP
jgi:Anti-sigma-D factor RsdA to sigma factor binding region